MFKGLSSIWITVVAILATPATAYFIFHYKYAYDPDVVYSEPVTGFRLAWEKVAEADDFTEYMEKSKTIRNADGTMSIMVLRNYSSPQTSKNEKTYRSKLMIEEIDCSSELLLANQALLYDSEYGKGKVIESQNTASRLPIRIQPSSIAWAKYGAVCDATSAGEDVSWRWRAGVIRPISNRLA